MLLLVCILSLQTSWAAVHFCDESAALAHVAGTADASDALGDAAEAGAALHDDQCCSAAHGGHVLQSLISQEPPALAVGPARHGPAEKPRPQQPRRALAQIEHGGFEPARTRAAVQDEIDALAKTRDDMLRPRRRQTGGGIRAWRRDGQPGCLQQAKRDRMRGHPHADRGAARGHDARNRRRLW